jgi:hypothetical protein
VVNFGGPWAFTAGLTDADGQPLKDVKYAPESPDRVTREK